MTKNIEGVNTMEVRAIRSEAAYRAMLAEVFALVDLDPHPDRAAQPRL